MASKVTITQNSFDETKAATLTGAAIQDDETFKSEGGFVPERDQFYFELKQGGNTFLLGFKDILTCVKVLENLEEIPKIGDKWWMQIATLYGQDMLMIESVQKDNP